MRPGTCLPRALMPRRRDSQTSAEPQPPVLTWMLLPLAFVGPSVSCFKSPWSATSHVTPKCLYCKLLGSGPGPLIWCPPHLAWEQAHGEIHGLLAEGSCWWTCSCGQVSSARVDCGISMALLLRHACIPQACVPLSGLTCLMAPDFVCVCVW